MQQVAFLRLSQSERGGKWETHFKRKFKEVNRKCEKGEI